MLNKAKVYENYSYVNYPYLNEGVSVEQYR